MNCDSRQIRGSGRRASCMTTSSPGTADDCYAGSSRRGAAQERASAVTDAPVPSSRLPAAATAHEPRRKTDRDALPAVPPWLMIVAVLLTAAVVGRFMADGKLK